MKTWEQEKAYCRCRAEALFSEMEIAISEKDRERFSAAYRTAIRYAKKKELAPIYKRFLARMNGG